jgi:hypothetical protein
MSQPWKQIERRGVCHYPDVSSENIYIVSVDDSESLEHMARSRHSLWREFAERYRGGTWFVVVFDELSPSTLYSMSSPPFATLEEAVRFAEEKIPTGIVWEGCHDKT